MMVAACGHEGGLIAVFLHELEPHHVFVEGDGAVEVGDAKMDVADAGVGMGFGVHGIGFREGFRCFDKHRRPRATMEQAGPQGIGAPARNCRVARCAAVQRNPVRAGMFYPWPS